MVKLYCFMAGAMLIFTLVAIKEGQIGLATFNIFVMLSNLACA